MRVNEFGPQRQRLFLLNANRRMQNGHRLIMIEKIVHILTEHYPALQGIYLFGSYATEREWPESDVDIAVLLPPIMAKETGPLRISPCAVALTMAIERQVDLVNVRLLSTVFQYEIICYGRLIQIADIHAVAEFEMVVMSLYQKLNEERIHILNDFYETKKAYPL